MTNDEMDQFQRILKERDEWQNQARKLVSKSLSKRAEKKRLKVYRELAQTLSGMIPAATVADLFTWQPHLKPDDWDTPPADTEEG